VRLPVLTLRQPWAGLVVLGTKTVENRSWRPKLLLPFKLLIHAGQSEDEGYDGPWFKPMSARGIIGMVTVIGYVDDDGVEGEIPIRSGSIPKNDLLWLSQEPGIVGWVLREAKTLAVPIPATGRLGIWWHELKTKRAAPKR
jgi:ASCH domain